MRRDGAALLALLAMLAVQKTQAGLAPELLWICHVTSAMLAMGLLAQAPLLIVTGFLCQVAVAVPAYALHVLSGGETTVVSFILHVLSPVFGWLAWRGKRIPAVTPWLGAAVYIGLLLICRQFTPEALNVNVAFRPWGPLADYGIWSVTAMNLVLLLVQTTTFLLLWNRFAVKSS
jgi:hypothetical protein